MPRLQLSVFVARCLSSQFALHDKSYAVREDRCHNPGARIPRYFDLTGQEACSALIVGLETRAIQTVRAPLPN